MMKSPGQIAYEAYAGKTDWKSLISGQPLPQWPSQHPMIREAWNEAASAVRVFLGTMKAWRIDEDTFAAETADEAMAFAMALYEMKREEFDDEPEEVPLTDAVWTDENKTEKRTLAQIILAEASFPCFLCSTVE